MDRESFGGALKDARKAAGLTMGELARELDLSVSYIADVEHGRRAPFKTDQVLKAAKVLGCDAQPLLQLACRERGGITVKSNDETKMNVVAGLARSIDVLTPDQMRQIEDIIKGGGRA